MSLEAQDTSYHDKRLAERLKDPAFAAEFQGAVDLLAQDEALPPEGSLADGPRPARRFNARTRRNELVKPDARKLRNKRQRQARKANR